MDKDLVTTRPRTSLRESIEFVDATRRISKTFVKAGKNINSVVQHPIWREKVSSKTALSYFLIQCSQPINFYFIYFYCANILKASFHFTPAQVISHNFTVAIVHLLKSFILSCLSYKIYPLKILYIRLVLSIISMISIPFLLINIDSPFQLLLIQILILVVGFSEFPAMPIFFKHFPVLRRFTYTSFSFSISRAVMYVITSYGLVYLTQMFNHYGLLIIAIPVYIGCIWGLNNFKKLEMEDGSYR